MANEFIARNGLISQNNSIISGSLEITNGITGSLFGTSSWANNSSTASYALNAISSSYSFTSSIAVSASYAATASYVILAQTASYITTAQTASYVLNAVSSSFASTSSYIENAQTASYVLNAVSSSYSSTASYAESSQTASYVQNAQTASYITTAQTASYVLNAVSSSYSSTASYVELAQTASYVINAQTASYVLNAISSSYALTASYALNGGGNIDTGSLLITASAALNTITFTKGDGSTFPITVNTGSGGGGSVSGGALSGSFGITIDGAGSSITTGNKGYVTIPYAGTITGWNLIADQSGSCVIDVWKTGSGNIPTIANTITGTEKPTLSSQQINSDLTLTSWTSSILQGDIIAFNIDSASTVTRVNLSIYITKQ